jgi:hypothetical protein
VQRIAPAYGFPWDGKEVFNLIGINSTRELFFYWLEFALMNVKPSSVELEGVTYFVSIEGAETREGFRLIGILSLAQPQREEQQWFVFYENAGENEILEKHKPQEIVLACVEIRETAPGQIQAICETLPIPKILEALERLGNEIKRVYGLDYENSEDERQVTENSVEEESTTSETSIKNKGNVTLEDAKRLVSDKPTMIEHKDDETYNPQTAIEIVEAIPKAWGKHHHTQWGPGIIAKFCKFDIRLETVSRYLGAFVRRGIKRIDGIEVPHRFH